MKQTLQEKIDACFSPQAAYATGGLWRIGEDKEDFQLHGYPKCRELGGAIALTQAAWDDFVTDYSGMFLPRAPRPEKRKGRATVLDCFGNVLFDKSCVKMRLCPWVSMIGVDECTVSPRMVCLAQHSSSPSKSVLQPWSVLTLTYATSDSGYVSVPAYWQAPEAFDDDKMAMLRGIVYLVRGVAAMLQAGNMTLRGRAALLGFIDRCLDVAVAEHRSDHLQRLIDAAKAADDRQKQEFWDRLAPQPRRFLKKGKK